MAVVLTTLLYGCETVDMKKTLKQFHHRCLRRILNIRWQHKIPDTEVLEMAGLPSIVTSMHKAGDVFQMADSQIPKQLFYGELHHGRRKVRGQRKCYRD